MVPRALECVRNDIAKTDTIKRGHRHTRSLSPHRMDEITFLIIWRLHLQAPFPQIFFGVIIAFSVLEQSTLLRRFHQERRNRRWPNAILAISIPASPANGYSRAGRENEEQATHFLVFGSKATMVKAQVIRTSSAFTASPSTGALATCSDISMLDRPVEYVT